MGAFALPVRVGGASCAEKRAGSAGVQGIAAFCAYCILYGNRVTDRAVSGYQIYYVHLSVLVSGRIRDGGGTAQGMPEENSR